MRGHSICYMHCESTVKIKGYLAKKSVFAVKGDVGVRWCRCITTWFCAPFLWLVYGLVRSYCVNIYTYVSIKKKKGWYKMWICFETVLVSFFYFFKLNLSFVRLILGYMLHVQFCEESIFHWMNCWVFQMCICVLVLLLKHLLHTCSVK